MLARLHRGKGLFIAYMYAVRDGVTQEAPVHRDIFIRGL